MAELKPCPFCGSTLFMCVNKYRHDQCTYSVKCSNSACNIIPFTYECSEETQAISDWNKRADADDVKHGEWIEIDNLVIEHGLPTVKGKTWRCSICGEARKNRTAPDMNFCPNCGAKMDLKEGAEE